MSEYLHRQFMIPAVWPDATTEAGFTDHVGAVMRRAAIEAGESLTGVIERVGEAQPGGVVDTDDGPVQTMVVTYRAEIAESADITTSAVQAREAGPGIWVADVPPGAAIVNVLHGLGTLGVDVDALDGTGQPCGYRGFVPVSAEEVEVIPSAVTRHIEVRLSADEIEARTEAALRPPVA